MISGSPEYHQVNSSAPMEGDLRGELWAGDHGPEGVFQSLKGMALTPPELSFTVQDVNYNDGRVDSQTPVVGAAGDWLQYGPVETGAYDPQQIVRGTDKHMPK